MPRSRGDVDDAEKCLVVLGRGGDRRGRSTERLRERVIGADDLDDRPGRWWQPPKGFVRRLQRLPESSRGQAADVQRWAAERQFPDERELPHQWEHTSWRGWPGPVQLSCVPQSGRHVRELAPDGLREQARWSQFLECRLCCLPQLLEAPRSDASRSAEQLQLDAADHLQLHESEGQEGARRLRWSPAEIHPPIEREHDDDDCELISVPRPSAGLSR